MFQIAYFVITIGFMKSLVNGSVIGRIEGKESSHWLQQLDITKIPIFGWFTPSEDPPKHDILSYENDLPEDPEAPIPIGDALPAIQEEIDKADEAGKKYYEKLLTKLKGMLSIQPLRYTRIFFRNMWHAVDLDVLGSRQRTRSISAIDSILIPLGDLLRWIANSILDFLTWGSSNSPKEVSHNKSTVTSESKSDAPATHPTQPSKEESHSTQISQPLISTPTHSTVHHTATGSTPAPSSPITTIHQVIHKFEFDPIDITFDLNITSRLIDESTNPVNKSDSHDHQNNHGSSQVQTKPASGDKNPLSSHVETKPATVDKPPVTKSATQLEDEKRKAEINRLVQMNDQKLKETVKKTNENPTTNDSKAKGNPTPSDSNKPALSQIPDGQTAPQIVGKVETPTPPSKSEEIFSQPKPLENNPHFEAFKDNPIYQQEKYRNDPFFKSYRIDEKVETPTSPSKSEEISSQPKRLENNPHFEAFKDNPIYQQEKYRNDPFFKSYRIDEKVETPNPPSKSEEISSQPKRLENNPYFDGFKDNPVYQQEKYKNDPFFQRYSRDHNVTETQPIETKKHPVTVALDEISHAGTLIGQLGSTMKFQPQSTNQPEK